MVARFKADLCTIGHLNAKLIISSLRTKQRAFGTTIHINLGHIYVYEQYAFSVKTVICIFTTPAFFDVLLTELMHHLLHGCYFHCIRTLEVICDCGMVKAADAVMCCPQGSVKVLVEVDY